MMSILRYFALTIALAAIGCVLVAQAAEPTPIEPLAGTQPLTWNDDLASKMVDGIDRFLLRKLAASPAAREQAWQLDTSSAAAYDKSLEPHRRRLAHILGVRDARLRFESPELVAAVGRGPRVGRGDGYDVVAVHWPVLASPQPGTEAAVSIFGEGLLLVPTGRKPLADVIALPDADQTPEQLVGLAEGVERSSQFARRLAEAGCRVLVPTLISREMTRRNGRALLSNREYLYRSAFELGRHIIGYELQKIFAGVDWFAREADDGNANIGVIGYGEGGMLALYAGALDTRIDATCVLGFFGPREGMWQEPLDRNVFGLLERFGAAELATMVSPRKLSVENSAGPVVELPGEGGAPAKLTPPDVMAAHRERERTEKLVLAIGGQRVSPFPFTTGAPSRQELVSGSTLGEFVAALNPAYARRQQPKSSVPEPDAPLDVPDGAAPRADGKPVEAAARQQRQVAQIDRHNQMLLAESPLVRKQFMSQVDTSSLPAFEKSIEHYRQIFRDDVIGRFDDEILPANPRTRKKWETEKWTGYEVVLDVWPDVFAFGVLLLPKDLKTDGSQRRPVVVCQHGLEGRPTDTFLDDHRAYHDFAAKLAERGFITFAPQNPYIFQDRFRTLQRKANPLGKSLFSIIVPQHQQIVDWLQSLPYVDPDRVAFYGLSYGGKTAMRVPALVTDYCLSICSADFNEWVRKNASTRHPFSYVWTGEYEIFEFDLGSTFNYAEMAALICPRPFMVERGHFDGVGWDEWVAYEFAKVRHLYQAKLGIGDRTEIEWFVGPHTINGQATFDFLHRHLQWPKD